MGTEFGLLASILRKKTGIKKLIPDHEVVEGVSDAIPTSSRPLGLQYVRIDTCLSLSWRRLQSSVLDFKLLDSVPH